MDESGPVNVAAAMVALKLLHALGAKVISHADCPECGACSVTDYDHRQHLCGFCGYGPWHVTVSGNEYGPPIAGQMHPYRKVARRAHNAKA